MKAKHLVVGLLLAFALAAVTIGILVFRTKNTISDCFKLNGQLKAQGYYMAEFEFKMLGCAYYLDKGRYVTALVTINRIRDELASKKGLVKAPDFSSKKEKLEFYQGLQNPRTGAFMDDSFPFFTYSSPTLNMIDYLSELSTAVGRPVELKYPLKFLDEINDPVKLKAFLDDLAAVGRVGARFRPPYVVASELSYYSEVFEGNSLYRFSPQWKKALLEWFYDNQDPETGYWGARFRGSGKLLNNGDLLSTEKIIRLYVDASGENIHPDFPLRFADRMIGTTIKKISEPMPENLDEIHEWILMINRGTRFLTKFLWSHISDDDRERFIKLMKINVKSKFENCYVENDGAFSLYPGAAGADLDGTGETLDFLEYMGALPGVNRERIWGSFDNRVVDLGSCKMRECLNGNPTGLIKAPDVNSIRFYPSDPAADNYDSIPAFITYPRRTSVLDSMDLLPRVYKWIGTTRQNMGNWVSKDKIMRDVYSGRDVVEVPVYTEEIPMDHINRALRDGESLVAVGFDSLQTPRYKLTLVKE